MAFSPVEKAILKAVGANPRLVSPGSIQVSGGLVSWYERCKRGSDECLHARTLSAPSLADLLDAEAQR